VIDALWPGKPLPLTLGYINGDLEFGYPLFAEIEYTGQFIPALDFSSGNVVGDSTSAPSEGAAAPSLQSFGLSGSAGGAASAGVSTIASESTSRAADIVAEIVPEVDAAEAIPEADIAEVRASSIAASASKAENQNHLDIEPLNIAPAASYAGVASSSTRICFVSAFSTLLLCLLW
jgi:hypothetical protein